MYRLMGLLCVLPGLTWASCPAWDDAQAQEAIAALQQQVSDWDQSYRETRSTVADELYDQARARLDQWRA